MAKKTVKRRIAQYGIVHILSTFNNTIITIADTEGNVVCWSSAGRIGFKGAKKGTPFAAQQCSEACGREAVTMGIQKVDVHVKGPGPGREAAIRSLQNAGLKINSIRDITPIPHNGCRPPKPRRV